MARERITSSDTRPPGSREAKLEDTHTHQHSLHTLQLVRHLDGWRLHTAKALQSGTVLRAGGEEAQLGQACRMIVQAGERALQAAVQSSRSQRMPGRQVLVQVRLEQWLLKGRPRPEDVLACAHTWQAPCQRRA